MNAKLCLLLATLLWGFWGLGEKYAVARVHPYTVQWMYSLPYVVLLPVWILLARRTAPQTTLDWTALGWAAGASITSLLATLLLVFAMRTEPASVATAVTATYPLVVLMLGVLSGEETLTARRLIGLGLAVGGVIVMQLPER